MVSSVEGTFMRAVILVAYFEVIIFAINAWALCNWAQVITARDKPIH
jgi:type IV secretory pathway TrbD component